MPLNGTVWVVRAIFLDEIALISSKCNDNIATINFFDDIPKNIKNENKIHSLKGFHIYTVLRYL